MCLISNERKSICVNSLCFVSCSYFRFYGPIKRYQRFEGVVYIFRAQINKFYTVPWSYELEVVSCQQCSSDVALRSACRML